MHEVLASIHRTGTKKRGKETGRKGQKEERDGKKKVKPGSSASLSFPTSKGFIVKEVGNWQLYSSTIFILVLNYICCPRFLSWECSAFSGLGSINPTQASFDFKSLSKSLSHPQAIIIIIITVKFWKWQQHIYWKWTRHYMNLIEM